MPPDGKFKSAPGEKIDELSKDSAALVHPRMIHGIGRATGLQSNAETEIVYPNGSRESLEMTERFRT
jgi:hypothetical protein